MNENKKIMEVYNNSEIITGAGYTMKSNYIVPMLSRMVDEGIINNSAETVVQLILQYKHGEENPFPSRNEIARVLGKSVSYVKKALKSIKDAGILAIEKAGRKNTYSFKPFFTLLEKFIVELKQNGNYEVKISDLLNVKVQKKEEHDFSWSENYTGEKEIVAEEPKKEVVDKGQPEEVVVLPEKLTALLKSNEVDDEGINFVEKKYTAYKDALHVDVFAEKINASVGKTNFIKFFRTCIDNAYINNEQPKQVPSKNNYQNNQSKQPTRKEIVPDWFEDRDKPKKRATMEELISRASVEELAEYEKSSIALLELAPNNKSALQNKEWIEKRKEVLGIVGAINIQ